MDNDQSGTAQEALHGRVIPPTMTEGREMVVSWLSRECSTVSLNQTDREGSEMHIEGNDMSW